MATTTSFRTQKLRASIFSSHHTFRNLYNSLPRSLALSSRTSALFFSSSHRALNPPTPLRPPSLRRRFSARAESSDNGAEPRQFDFDLFTIGAGSGGVRASRFAASYGASVAVCELPFATISSESAGGFGGTCVLRGCVPKKLLVYASKYSHEFEESHGFGWRYKAEPKHDWSTLIANKNAELQRLTGIYKNILKNAGVELIEGRGKIIDPHTVDVDGKLYSARHILISVGGRPYIPDIPGSEYAIDSDAALDLPEKPKKIAIVGGGYIALEFAGIFNGLRIDVHVFIRQKKVLRGFDEEIRDFVAEQMSLRGIEFHTEESPQAILKSPDGSLSLKTNKGTTDGFSHIMFATGRRPNTKNLGLEAVGVKMAKNGAIEVDEYSRTSVPSIWAVGDVTDRINLTPVALMEGGALAKTVFANEPTKPDYRAVPSAVFSQPPLGQVGLSEEQGNTLFMTLNKIARADPKYGDVFLLENYAAFQTSLYELANLVPALAKLYQQASDAYEQACTRYVHMIIYSQFEQLLQYATKIEDLITTNKPEEIRSMPGMSTTDLRRVLKLTLSEIDRSINAMYKALQRNLTLKELVRPLHIRFKKEFMSKYQVVVELVGNIYHTETKWTPSIAQVRDLLACVKEAYFL